MHQKAQHKIHGKLHDKIDMRKKIRFIVVDEVNYNWTVVENEFPCGTLNIWNQEEKNKPFLQLPISITELLKPSDVARHIRVNVSKTRAINKGI